MGRIGVYGGTFNPPHSGHVLAMQEFARQLDLDKVLMIPDAEPPHKVMPDGSPDPMTRLELCRLATAGLPFVEVCDLEIRREGKSYTAITMAELSKQYPNDRLVLLMGTDMFLSFDRWRDPDVITAYADLAMAHRSDPSETELATIDAQKRKLETLFSASVSVLGNDLIDISSSEIRAMLRFGIGENVLPPQVYTEIQKRGLYQTRENLRGLPFEQLKAVSLSLHKQKRAAHAAGCCETAVRLAKRWGADPEAAARAGILHDVTKILDGPEQLLLCQKYAILIDSFDEQNHKLLHAMTGAAVAREIFGESDAVCEAIRWHTTGKANMTTLEQIIYLADLIEPTRTFPGVDALRAAAMEDLDSAMLLALERSVTFVQEGGSTLHPNSLYALEWQRTHRNDTVQVTENQ